MRIKGLLTFALLTVLILAAASWVAADDSEALDKVLQRLESNVASIKTLSTSFTQKKQLAAFSHEIEMSGMVYIKKPSTLAWHVTEPIKYSVLITDSFIRQWDEDTDQVQQMSFKSNPMLSTALEQITVWFDGKYASLKKDYDIKLVSEAPVVLRFTPRTGNMSAKVIAEISVGLAPDERYLEWIKIVETGGDTTTITFSQTQFNEPLKDSHFEVKGGR